MKMLLHLAVAMAFGMPVLAQANGVSSSSHGTVSAQSDGGTAKPKKKKKKKKPAKDAGSNAGGGAGGGMGGGEGGGGEK